MKAIFAIILASISVLGCTNHKMAQEPQSKSELDSVKIISVFPPLTDALEVGSRVTFRYEVEYSLQSADTASLVLLAQTESNDRAIGEKTYVIDKGIGTQVMELEVEVPETPYLQLFTPLTPQGKKSTSIVDWYYHKVK